ncbi:SDR family NAD(P)-dependent oxidoreductase [Pacificimonas sp. WHA3]|uniref:SDR family NAD(P)-dependent oxidoreductase n=1 Tax=Pacificimonas pallii TaxID=2827236 RepID=A0ABS6SGS2_9SPHN|nr:SDR family NAD(P)-dependent oxidoreductase [Pacificimonas pallii]MBV7257086.1 SDR family NAD(P)-dependent oxidoreductase [Pacificimonas pallii]
MDKLEGKVAFVTGAASGIGLGIATALAQAGVKVMLCDIEKDALARAVEALAATNADVDGVLADVSLKAELQAAADKTIARFHKVNILVNNAGVGGGAGYGEWTDASWDWTIGVNLMSVIWGFEIFGPLIEKAGEGGQIVSTASMAGHLPITGPAYAVTKFGVVALSENLRPVLAEKGIGVSVLCPGFIRTNIMESTRNVPSRLAGNVEEQDMAKGPVKAFAEMARKAIENGIDPLYVGELVREGIEGDWMYIFTDNEFEPGVDARYKGVKEGFDMIRGREPAR